MTLGTFLLMTLACCLGCTVAFFLVPLIAFLTGQEPW